MRFHGDASTRQGDKFKAWGQAAVVYTGSLVAIAKVRAHLASVAANVCTAVSSYVGLHQLLLRIFVFSRCMGR